MADECAQPLVSVIIPALNERGNLPPLISKILEVLGEYGVRADILVADGGSTDGTQEEVRALEEGSPVRLVEVRSGHGLAGDVLLAAREAKGRVAVVMDADGSHDPEAIPKLIQPVLDGERGMMVGSRYVPGGQTRGWPLSRRLMSRAAAWLAWPWVEVRDPTSGFFAVRRDRLLAVDPRAEGFKIGLEVMLALGEEMRAGESPVSFPDRTLGRSKMSAKQALLYLRRLFSLAGGEVTPANAAKFAVVGLSGLVVDLLVFQVLWSLGFGLSMSHIASFFAATLTNYAFNAGWVFRETTGGRLHGVAYGRFLAVAFLALFLRGGLLALCHDGLGWPALVSVVAAIFATALVNYLGSVFFVFPKSTSQRSGVRWRTAAVGVIAYMLLLRLFYLGVVDLLPEEAYYWNYAQHPALGYLDHPPMVAWLVTLGTALFGHTEFGVRIAAYTCWLVAAGFSFAFARDLMGKAAALKAVMLMAVLPFFFSAGFIMTPDAPLTACWAGVLFFLERALLGEKRNAWWGVGICLGAGMLSKYTILLLGPAAMLFILLDRRSRRWLRRPEPYAAALLAAVLFMPVVVWNAENNWASFTFQTARRLGMKTQFSPHVLLGAILVLLTPVVAAAAFQVLFTKGRPGTREDPSGEAGARRRLFMAVFTLVPLSVFVLFSLTHEPKLEWTGPLWLAVLPAVAWQMGQEERWPAARLKVFFQRGWMLTFIVMLISLGGLLHYMTMGLPGIPYPRKMALPVAWEEFGQSVEWIKDSLGYPAAMVVGMDKYFIASEMAFYNRQDLPESRQTASRNLFGGDALMYDWWSPAREQYGKRLLLLSFKQKDLADPRLAPWLKEGGPVQEQAVEKDGRPVLRFYYRVVRYGAPVPTPVPKG